MLKPTSGNVFEDILSEDYIGLIAVCAEAIANGRAAAKGNSAIESIVAVCHTGKIVASCGVCREFISDYAPDALGILEDAAGIFTTAVVDLLPNKYEQE